TLARPSLLVAAVTETELASALEQAAGIGFALSREPPLRAHLFVLGAQQHVLLLLLHHIAWDGWSLFPLMRDLSRCYAAWREWRVAEPPPLPVQYADFTLWQQEALGDETNSQSPMARQMAFWRETLRGLPEQMDLPSDRPRPAVISHCGGSIP